MDLNNEFVFDHWEVMATDRKMTDDKMWGYLTGEVRKAVSYTHLEKGESKVEFYEYSDGETTDGVYNRISYDFNQDLEFKEREKYERKLEQGGKIFEISVDGIDNIVAYRDNTVVYGRCPEQERDEIVKIIEKMGYK